MHPDNLMNGFSLRFNPDKNAWEVCGERDAGALNTHYIFDKVEDANEEAVKLNIYHGETHGLQHKL